MNQWFIRPATCRPMQPFTNNDRLLKTSYRNRDSAGCSALLFQSTPGTGSAIMVLRKRQFEQQDRHQPAHWSYQFRSFSIIDSSIEWECFLQTSEVSASSQKPRWLRIYRHKVMVADDINHLKEAHPGLNKLTTVLCCSNRFDKQGLPQQCQASTPSNMVEQLASSWPIRIWLESYLKTHFADHQKLSPVLWCCRVGE